MTVPSDASKVHMNEGSDDPKQARAELADLVDKFNTYKGHPSSLSHTLLALAAAADWRSNLDIQQLINSLAEETAPAVGDLLGLRDTSAGADRKMTLANALKVINGLSELTSVDGANDFLLGYDTSAGTAKKIKPDNLGGVFSESFTSAEQTITSGAFLSIAHGLSGLPELVQPRLICKIAELGYTIGDQVIINPHTLDGNAKGQALFVGSSNIHIRYGADPAVYNLLRRDDGTRATATNSSWRLIVKAWR